MRRFNSISPTHPQQGSRSCSKTRSHFGSAKEVAGEGIRVNVVRPGVVSTDIHASGGEPEEVARAVLWLLSEEASYSTGALVDASGGR